GVVLSRLHLRTGREPVAGRGRPAPGAPAHPPRHRRRGLIAPNPCVPCRAGVPFPTWRAPRATRRFVAKRPSALLESNAAEIDALYRTAPIGLCLIDRSLRYVRINERLAEMNGLSAADHIGRTIRQVIPGLADIVEPRLRRVLRTGRPVLNLEFAGQTA